MLKLMKAKRKIMVTVFAFLMSFAGTATVYADCNPCDNGNGVVCIPNPLRFCSIQELLTEITNLLIQLGLALVAFMVIVGGLFIMFGGANPKYFEKGKNIITWTVLGLFVVLFARGILAVIRFVMGG